jgi:hypothetical protein
MQAIPSPEADNKALIHRWFDEVWNQGREDLIDELRAPEAVATGLGETDVPVRGPAKFKTFYRNLRSSFPDLHARVDDMVVAAKTGLVRSVRPA